MEQISISWSNDEFKAYLLIYASQSNQIISKTEKELIEQQFDPLLIKAMQKEINLDTDYEKIQKIMAYIDQHNLTKDDLDALLVEVHKVFLCDGKYDSTEQSIYLFLQKLFKL